MLISPLSLHRVPAREPTDDPALSPGESIPFLLLQYFKLLCVFNNREMASWLLS